MATVPGARHAPLTLFARFRLPIMDTYILREFVWPFLGAFAIFFLFWAFNIFFLAAQYIIGQNAPFFLAMRFIVFRIPQSIPFAFPFACLTATILGIGRLAQDNEINAIRTAGISLWRFCLTPLLFGLAMFGVSYCMNEYVAPKSVDQSTRAFYQIVYKTSSLPIEQQFFRKDPATNNEFFVTQLAPDGKTMLGVQIFKTSKTPGFFWNETLQAQSARVNGPTLVLQNVVDTRYNPQGFLSSQIQTKQVSIGLPLGENIDEFLSAQNNDPWAETSEQLKQHIIALKAQGNGGEALGSLEVKLGNKVSFPFASFVAVIIALPLAIRFGRKGRMLGIALSILAFFVYYILNDAAEVLGSTGRVNPYLAAWFPNIVFGAAGLILLWSEEH